MSLFSQLFGGGNATQTLLALDIGTEVVKALVFNVDKKQSTGTITGVGKVRQKQGNMQNGAVSDISGVIETAKEAIAKAKEQAQVKKVKKAILGIAGEYVKGTTTTVHYQRVRSEKPIEVSELKNIIRKVQEKAYERIVKQLEYEMGHRIDIRLINAAIVDVRIDGYRITNPIGFKGRDVSIGVFNAYAPMIHLGALESIAQELGIDLLNIAAEPYAVSMSVGFDDVLDFSAIFIDIGGGTTDIAVVRNGGLEGTKMFALGGRAFTKKIAQEFSLRFEEAEKIKIDYALQRLEQNATVQIERALGDDCRVWLSGVELSLGEFSDTSLLPSTVYLCGGGSGLPGIKNALEQTDWFRELPFAKQPEIRFLQPRDVSRIKDNSNILTTPQDVTPMGLAALAIDLANEEKVVANLLRKAMRTVQ